MQSLDEPLKLNQQFVARVDLRKIRAVARRLPIRGRRNDEPQELLRRPILFAKLAGQPVEQLGMGWRRTLGFSN